MSYTLSEDAQLTWLLEELRSKRNLKLVLSDWTQLPDCPLSEDKKEEWKTYRQALRDLPEGINTINPDRTLTVEWPLEPGD